MTPQEALKQSNLTGTGTLDSLTVDLDTGQQITLTRDDVQTWPDCEHTRVSTVLVGTVPIELRFAVDLMQRAQYYFELVSIGTRP